MKIVKLILILMLTSGMFFTAKAEKKDVKTVLYHVGMHCASCKAKIEKNIPYEKGVKGLDVDLEAKTVKVTFRKDKNTTEGIQKAIEKLNFEVSGAEEIKAGDNQEAKTKETKPSKERK